MSDTSKPTANTRQRNAPASATNFTTTAGSKAIMKHQIENFGEFIQQLCAKDPADKEER